MQKQNTYKLKGSKLKKNFNFFFIFILLIFNITSCMHKEKIDTNNPLVAKLIYPQTIAQGTLTDIKVQITNRGLYPITVIAIQIADPTTTRYYRGTTYLKALKHQFRKGKRFNMKYYSNKKLAGRKEHAVPEVHKLKTVIYPGKTRSYPLKALIQNIHNDTYKNNISISYLYLDKNWINKVYSYKGKTLPNKQTIVREFYKVESQLPNKIEGSLVASGDLGEKKFKNLNISIKLTGWNFKNKKLPVEYSVFLKKENVWIYNTNGNSYIAKKNGDKIKIKGMNSVKPFIKAIIEGKTKIHILDKDYKNLKKEIKKYNFILKNRYFDAKLTKKQLYDFLNKILTKGYAFHKHGEVLELKQKN